jgi:hypothetical protein
MFLEKFFSDAFCCDSFRGPEKKYRNCSRVRDVNNQVVIRFRKGFPLRGIVLIVDLKK